MAVLLASMIFFGDSLRGSQGRRSTRASKIKLKIATIHGLISHARVDRIAPGSYDFKS